MQALNSTRQAGLPLSQAGGLPRPVGPIDAATGAKKLLTPVSDAAFDMVDRVGQITPSLSRILRPQAAYRWLLPYLSSITPLYVEGLLRGALAGNHVSAWELFDLMIDTNPEISACVQEYVEGVLSHRIVVEAYHEEDEEPTPKAIEKQKLISAALRGMRPVPQNDENSIRGTIRDLLFARFHNQSVCEVDWTDPRTGKPNFKVIPGQSQYALVPRATYWVHPVCYAYSTEGVLGLRAAIADLADSELRRGSPADQLNYKPGVDRLSYAEPPQWNYIASQPRPSSLAPFPDNKFLISFFKAKAGSALGGSCLRPLAAWWVFSNFCGDYLMNFAQICGIPFRTATVNPNAPEQIKAEIRQMLQSMGSTSWALLPEGTEVNFADTGSGAGQSPQAFLIHLCDSYMRRVILHQTMTGGQHDSMGKGGGKAFGEVEDETKDQCIGAGCRFAEEQINQQLVPMILAMNYGEKDFDTEVPEVKLVDSAVGGLADAQTLQAVSTLINVPDSFVRRMFGVPKLSTDDEIAGIDQGTTGAQQQEQARQFDTTQRNQAAQADANRKNGAKQADANRQHQLKLAKAGALPAPAPGGAGNADGPQSGKQKADDNQSITSRNAELEAAAPDGHPFYGNQWTEEGGSPIVPLNKKTTLGSEVVWKDEAGAVHHGQLGFKEHKEIPWEEATPKQREWSNGKTGAERKAIVETGNIKVDEVKINTRPHPTKPNTTIRELVPTGVTHAVPAERLAHLGKGGGFKQREFRSKDAGFAFKRNGNLNGNGHLEAKAEIPVETKQDVASALHDTVEPLLERLKAIEAIRDPKLRAKMMKKLLKDIPQLSAAMVHDDSIAKAFAPSVVRAFVEKLSKEKKN